DMARNNNSKLKRLETAASVEGFDPGSLVAGCKNQLLKIRIASQRIKILISLGSDPKAGWEIERAFKRLKRSIDCAEPGSGGREAVMYVCSFRFPTQGSFE